ncbi:MAG: diguanylate cyclase [Candidatus Metalachnospira sp.]|nr:diguanylate cyclase [Candidatus Metalachnospira sp.]
MLISLIVQANSDKVQKQEIIINEQRLVDVERAIISNKINRLVSDVLYISDSLKLNDDGNGDYSKVEQQWLAFSNRKTLYDQIRFIDLIGNEVIRVNYSNDGAYLVGKEYLQNKKGRYFFTDTLSLNKDQVYISKLDLNIEGGEIEEPIKPTIRLSVPYYGKNDELEGIVVLNYSASDMLGQVNRISSTSNGNICMLNSDGYWLYNRLDTEKEWTFMYQDRVNESFVNSFPDEWNEIKSNGTGHLVTQNGVFNYTDVMADSEFSLDSNGYSLVLGQGDWYIVSYISPDTQEGMLFNRNLLSSIFIVLKKNTYAYLMILLTTIGLAILMASNKIEKDRTKYFSEYDGMTGVYNRRAGFEKLNQLYKDVSKFNYIISVCFIDINALKEVNDFLGHTEGDNLILTVVDGIKKNIRESDIVVRLGGDEFLIIFIGVDEDGSELIWQRIVNDYEQINNNENRKYLVSVSHGIEVFRCSTDKYIDDIINHADEKMYSEKRLIKQNLKVIKSE